MVIEADKIYAYAQDSVREYVRGSEAHDRGDWMPAGTYAVEDVVAYAGAWYFCLRGNTGMAPAGLLDTFWSPLVEVEAGKALGDLDDIINDIRERIDAILGQIADLGDRIDDIQGQIDVINGKIDAILGQIDVINGKIDAILAAIDAIQGQIDSIQGQVDVIRNRDLAVYGIVELRARTDHVDRLVTFLAFLNVPFDGQGGVYVFQASAMNADDDIDWIKPNDTNASLPGRWWRSNNP